MGSLSDGALYAAHDWTVLDAMPLYQFMRGRWYFLGRRPPSAGRRGHPLLTLRKPWTQNGITGKRLAHGPLSMTLQAEAFPVMPLHAEKGDANRALINSS